MNQDARVKILGSRSEIRDAIQKQIKELSNIGKDKDIKTGVQFIQLFNEVRIWESVTEEMLRRFFTNDEIRAEFASQQLGIPSSPQTLKQKMYSLGLIVNDGGTMLQGLLKRIEYIPESGLREPLSNPLNTLSQLASHFNSVANNLTVRRTNRPPLIISDEYDLQYLFGALLRLFFDTIIPEEYVPSYAGNSSRIDFLIQEHKIVFETKMITENLGQKEVADQLIIDTARYKTHPDCETIFCFVYDPKTLLRNPVAIERDLSGIHEGKNVKVVVFPKA